MVYETPEDNDLEEAYSDDSGLAQKLKDWKIPEPEATPNKNKSNKFKSTTSNRGSSRITEITEIITYEGLERILAPNNKQLQDKIKSALLQPGRIEILTIIEGPKEITVATLKQVGQGYYIVSVNGSEPEYNHIPQEENPELFYRRFVERQL